MNVSEGFGSGGEGADEDAEKRMPWTRNDCPVPVDLFWRDGYKTYKISSGIHDPAVEDNVYKEDA